MAWLVSLKILLISSGVAALALVMKLYVPMVFEFSVSHLPFIWSSCKSLLTPPYLYVVINAIIITIAASSMFHNDRPQAKLPSPESESETIQPAALYEHREEPVMQPVVYEHREETVMPPVVYEHKEEAVIKEVTSVEPINNSADPVARVDQDREDEDELEVWSATSMTPKSVTKADEIALPAEKPLVSARFSHRKPARSTPEGIYLFSGTSLAIGLKTNFVHTMKFYFT